MRIHRESLWPLSLCAAIFGASSRMRLAAPEINLNLEISPDKLAHFLVFGLLATAVIRIRRLQDRGWQGWCLTVFLVSAFGLSDELHQLLTPGRTFELADWLADTLGASLAAWLYLKWDWYRKLLEYKPIKKAKPRTGLASIKNRYASS